MECENDADNDAGSVSPCFASAVPTSFARAETESRSRAWFRGSSRLPRTLVDQPPIRPRRGLEEKLWSRDARHACTRVAPARADGTPGRSPELVRFRVVELARVERSRVSAQLEPFVSTWIPTWFAPFFAPFLASLVATGKS